MWILSPQPEGTVTYYLFPGKKYVVGRKNCDILLSDDQSISRAHSHLTATDQTLTLTDTSKYGTFVNNQRLSENQSQSLKPGDTITFGVFHSKFSVDCQRVVVCSSCVDNDGKASLSQALLPLGGKLVNSWNQDCTHLVMPTVKVTIKTICALLCCRPIVKQEFFTELSKALEQKRPPPRAESFFPEIDEPSLNKEEVDLREKPERKRLFNGKIFVFLSAKQLKRLSSAVSFGGGKSQLLEEGSLPRSLLESPRSCVVDIATGNSQALLPTTRDWAESVRKILQEKGLRLITESEIGLAAIYSSCNKYCNPSNLMTDSESMRTVKPTIPSATLSQNAAVDETLFPGASLNITAFAVNTEPSQRVDQSEVTSVTAVGETPERSQNRNANKPSQSRPAALRETATTCTVAETMRSSLNTTQNTASQRKKPELQREGGGNGDSFLPPLPKTNGSVKASPQKCSPQKQKFSAQGSPQKQSTLTSFFQPVTKKRPRAEESCAVQSEPKRGALLSSTTPAQTSKQSPSNTNPHTLPTARTQSQQGSRDDLFLVQSEALSDRVSHPAQQRPQGTKRKEVEEVIEIEELESIMSQEMDDPDEQTLVEHSSTNRKQPLDAVEHLFSSKRLRINPEEHSRANQRPSLEEASAANRNQSLDMVEHTSSRKRQQLPPTEYKTANERPSTDPNEGSSANRNQHSQAVEVEEVSCVVTTAIERILLESERGHCGALDSEPLDGDVGQPNGQLETPLKPTTVKQEAPVSETREDLPKRLLVVEFKSLTVTAPFKAKPQQMQANGYTKNFKRFRKVQVPGAEGLPNIIGGSDLLAHNRGKNSELDEWLRDVAEEDRQNKRDESLGDDLFRYNPTKLIKRR